MPPYQMNPVNDFYLRQNTFNQLSFPPQPQTAHINCRFVTGIEEAKAAMIDPLSYNLFLDSGSGRIYLKKLSNNGQSDFICYSINQEETKDSDPLNEINIRLSNIESFLGGMKNDKSLSKSDCTEQSQAVTYTATAEQNESNGTAESSGFPKNAGNGWRKK